jgi:hypothetical protein
MSILKNLSKIFSLKSSGIVSPRSSTGMSTYACPMLTLSQFVRWLELRHSAGESLAAIGSSLGVSHAAVQKWLTH